MLSDLILKYIPLFLAIILHEVAHGYMALLMGDDTAKKRGRLSLNPLKHIDFFGTILLPVMLWIAHAGIILGWAKPVPIDFRKLKNKTKGMVFVSAAGIIMNIWLALVSALILLLVPFIANAYWQMMFSIFFLNMIVYNIVIALFNALPIPPLDGSKILFGWIRKPWAINYINAGKAGLAAVVVLIFVLPEIGKAFGQDWNLFRYYIISATRFFTSLLV